MNQREQINHIAGQTGLPKATVEKVLISHATIITAELHRGGEIVLPHGLGKLKVAESAAREGRNPATGETIQIPAKKRVVFKAAKALKEAMN